MSSLLLSFRDAAPEGSPSLRVAIVIGSARPARWVEALDTYLRYLPGIEVQLVCVPEKNSPGSSPPWLTSRLLRASRAQADPFANAAPSAREAFVLDIERMGTSRFDIVIWLASPAASGIPLRDLARHSVFTVRMGEGDSQIPFWEEVATSRITSSVKVFRHTSSFEWGAPVRYAELSTVLGLSFTRNAEEPAVAAIRMLGSLCAEILLRPEVFRRKTEGLPNEPVYKPTPRAWPSNLSAGRFLAEKLFRSARLRLRARGRETKWVTALRANPGTSVTDAGQCNLKGFADVPLPPGSRELADPVFWESGDQTWLFVEEVPVGSVRGRLGCMQVLGNGSFSPMKIILEADYHISYPCIVQEKGELYLLPEISDTGRVDLYRFTRFPWEIEKVRALVEGLPLVDTTPFFLDGTWYFFTTTLPPFMETLLFTSQSLEGDWKLHPASPISGSVKNSRSAGNLFRRDGALYRPTQDCSVRYGYGIQVNEVTRLTPDEFKEKPVNWIGPNWRPDLIGTHTWAETSKLQTLDGFIEVKSVTDTAGRR